MNSVSHTAPAADSTQPVILVVEDEVLVRLPLADYLRECGFKVLEAANADEALQVLTASDEPIDVVFSDVEMPGQMDGFGLARWVRANRPQTKVMLTSGHTRSAKLAAELCESGPLVTKPYDYSFVLDRIKKLFARSAEAAK
jgi:DNA-binding response OmpR family regulator